MSKFVFPPYPKKAELLKYAQSLANLTKTRGFLNDEVGVGKLFGSLSQEAFKSKILIDILPGFGALSRHALNSEAKGIIAVETFIPFLDRIKEYERISKIPIEYEHNENREDHSFPALLFDNVPVEQRKFERKTESWETLHSELAMSLICSSIKESYYYSFQLTNAIYYKTGWFKYGRFPLYMIAPPELFKGIIGASGPGFLWRAVAELEDCIDIPKELVTPGKTLQLLKLVPYSKPKIKSPLGTYCFITQKLTVRKKQSVKSCLPTIAPGLKGILTDINMNLKKNCEEITMEELDYLTQAYIKWYKGRFGIEPTHDIS